MKKRQLGTQDINPIWKKLVWVVNEVVPNEQGQKVIPHFTTYYYLFGFIPVWFNKSSRFI